MKTRARDEARVRAEQAQLDVIVMRMVRAGFPVTVAEGTITLEPPRRASAVPRARRGKHEPKILERPPSRERRSGGVRRGRRTGAAG